MPDPVDVVRNHLEAVARFDWDGLRLSMAPNARLTIKGVVQGDVTVLYRHITQAWDFTVADTRLSDEGGGAVGGVMLLVNGLWRKAVSCEYQVTSGRIASIALSDPSPTDA